MKYVTVMVSLALDQSNEACLAVAGDIAERFNARVIGVTAAEFSPPLYYTAGEAAEKFIDDGYASINQRMSELEAQFRDSLQKRAREIEWRCAREMPAKYIATQVRAADILVAGSFDTLTDPFAHANPSDLVMRIGRPLLLVPPTVKWLDLRSVLVAWKDNPEARRAITDSLPMLLEAKDVTIVEIIEGGDRSAALSRVRDIVEWLSHHGIFASSLVPEESGDTPAQLERIASNVGAGIVVAGAYGHSRFREWILGGVTQHLVKESTRCSLLSR